MKNKEPQGHVHPISRAIFDVWEIFRKLGFSIALGPEIETEWYNFDALNIPKDHPARDMQDTFWVKTSSNFQFPISPPAPELRRAGNFQTNPNESNSRQRSGRPVLRTHTSPVQIRYMEEKLKAGIPPPYRIIVPGKVFRNEATDATHEAQFFQLESLYVDKEVSLAHLKGVLEYFFKEFLGAEAKVRFRPSYFPFVEPGLEVDVHYSGKWLEMFGAGLVHPNVLRAVGLDSSEYTGFAFGGGIDRLVIVKYGITDIRLFYSGDLRLVNQF